VKSLRPLVALAALAAFSLVALAHAADAPAPVVLKTTDLGHGPTIVLVPGLGGARLDWMPTTKRLLATHHVVMVDLPGQGDSPLPEPFSLQAAAEALDGVLAKQNPDSTVVVGAGVGGLVSLLAVSAHPEHARGVVLIDAQIKSPIPIPDQQREQLFRYMDDNYQAFSQMAFSRMGRDSTENVRIMAQMAAVPAATVKAYFHQLIGIDANKDAKALKRPMTLLFTDRIWKSGMSWGTVAKGFGWDDSTIAVPRRITNAGYFVMKDQPDTLADIVRTFAAAQWARAK
jgi:pimeloyl-ACP methyl ester carboxylesterase